MLTWLTRSPRQRVVSFTFYHDAKFKNEKKKNFSAGISGNLALVRRLYGAGWTMRLYYDLDPGPAGQLQLRQLCELACAEPQLDLCRVRRLPGRPLEDAREVYPLLWRFLPSLDPQVSVFLSRDLDSRITAREVAAVAEWLGSPGGEAVHCMRDHPEHTMPIMGGMWGARSDTGGPGEYYL